MNWKEFLKPTKLKIAISLILPLIWIVIFTLIGYLTSLYEQGLSVVFPSKISLIYIIGFFINALFYYPLACFISMLIYIYRKEKKLGKVFSLKNVVLLILLILIFNPLSLPVTIYRLFLYMSSPIAKGILPCGLEILSVNDSSPAQMAGMSKGETIIGSYSKDLPDTPITNGLDFNEFLSKLNIGDEITIMTDKDNYNVTVGKSGNERPYIGIVVNTTFCKCGDGICEKGEKVIFHTTACTIINGKNLGCYPVNSTIVNCALDCK